MPDFSQAFQSKLEVQKYEIIDKIEIYNIDIVLFPTNFSRKFSILSTSGLSNFAMPQRTEEENQPHVELCFALPSYWDLSFASENSRWVVDKLKFLCHFVLEKQTHFWDGHTIPNAKPNRPFSKTMQQDCLLFSKSILHENELTSVELNNTKVYLLFLIPLFKKELDHKQARGTNAIKKKLVNANVGEILDDFRTVVITKRFGLF